MESFTIPAGTLFHIGGIPYTTAAPVEIIGDKRAFDEEMQPKTYTAGVDDGKVQAAG